MKKAISILLTMGLCAGLLAGCGAKSAATSEEATAENPMVMTLSHGLSETHTVHIAMEEFAEKVEERTDGRIKRDLPERTAWKRDGIYGAAHGRCDRYDKSRGSDPGDLRGGVQCVRSSVHFR